MDVRDCKVSCDLDLHSAYEATSAIFVSGPLTDDAAAWLPIEFGPIVILEKTSAGVTRKVNRLNTVHTYASTVVLPQVSLRTGSADLATACGSSRNLASPARSSHPWHQTSRCCPGRLA